MNFNLIPAELPRIPR